MIFRSCHRQAPALVLSLSVAVGICANAHAYPLNLHLNLVLAPTAVEDVAGDAKATESVGANLKGGNGLLLPAVQTQGTAANGLLVPAVKGASSGPEFRKAGGNDMGTQSFGSGGGAGKIGTQTMGSGGGAGKVGEANASLNFGKIGGNVADDFNPQPDPPVARGGAEFRKAGGQNVNASLNFGKTGDKNIGSATGGAGAGKNEVSSYQSGGHGSEFQTAGGAGAAASKTGGALDLNIGSDDDRDNKPMGSTPPPPPPPPPPTNPNSQGKGALGEAQVDFNGTSDGLLLPAVRGGSSGPEERKAGGQQDASLTLRKAGGTQQINGSNGATVGGDVSDIPLVTDQSPSADAATHGGGLLLPGDGLGGHGTAPGMPGGPTVPGSGSPTPVVQGGLQQTHFDMNNLDLPLNNINTTGRVGTFVGPLTGPLTGPLPGSQGGGTKGPLLFSPAGVPAFAVTGGGAGKGGAAGAAGAVGAVGSNGIILHPVSRGGHAR